ncbi:hypothetical protein SUGI_0177140 [Cryptomeria japonica]|nr:hypothetical protein SUGI_0177140 [Cryptomeria japonica]
MLVPCLSTHHYKIGRYDILTNMRAFVNVWTIKIDEKVWEKTKEFKSERFLGISLDTKGRDCEMLAFGSSIRMCSEANLGLKVVKLGLVNHLHVFHWFLVASNESPQELDMSKRFGLTTPKVEPHLPHRFP